MTVDVESATRPRRSGKKLQKFFWGGMGALAPIALSVVVLDHVVIGQWLEQIRSDGSGFSEVIGYSVRVGGLFLIGGLWASLHKSEFEPMKLFQLGIVAPAMITGLINAGNVDNARSLPEHQSESISWSLSILSSAHASVLTEVENATVLANEEEKKRPERVPSGFIRGLLGR